MLLSFLWSRILLLVNNNVGSRIIIVYNRGGFRGNLLKGAVNSTISSKKIPGLPYRLNLFLKYFWCRLSL